MKKRIKGIVFLAVMVASVWLGGILADGAQLRQDILRLHVVGASNGAADQQVKLRVRDAVVQYLEGELSNVKDMSQAMAYVESVLPKLEETANRVLEQYGFSDTVSVSLGPWEFPVRDYDTFKLPSGIYQALRIVIGEGEGENWWCVVFPQLCMSATSEEFVETASLDGMSPKLAGTLTGEYEIRFWVLDQLGKLGNFLHRDSE